MESVTPSRLVADVLQLSLAMRVKSIFICLLNRSDSIFGAAFSYARVEAITILIVSSACASSISADNKSVPGDQMCLRFSRAQK